jgi:hypothetical protein
MKDFGTVGEIENYRLPAGTYYIYIHPMYNENSEYSFLFIYAMEDPNKFEQESNDTFETANIVSTDTEINGNIQTNADQDWYKIVLESPGKVGFDINCASKELRVFIINSKDMKDNGYSSTIYPEDIDTKGEVENYRLPAGTYYIYISPMHTDNSIDYSFVLSYALEDPNRFEQESNDTFESANIVSADTEISGNIQNINDQDWYKIGLDSPVEVEFNIKCASEELRVNVINSKDMNDHGYSSTFYIDDFETERQTYQLPAGTYYINISPMYIDNSVDYSFTLETAAGKEAQNNTPPEIISTVPADKGKNVVVSDRTITIVFNEVILQDKNFNKISVICTGYPAVTIKKKISDNTLT